MDLSETRFSPYIALMVAVLLDKLLSFDEGGCASFITIVEGDH